MENQKLEKRVGIGGYIALLLFLVIFSGAVQNIPVLKALDFTNMLGAFGIIGEGGTNFVGTGGKGVRDGYLVVLSLVPTLMLSSGIVELVSHFGGFDAAGKLFTPLMRLLFGVPGSMAIPLVASLTSSDVGATTTRSMYDEKRITENERSKMIAFQAPGCGLIANSIIVMGMFTGVVDLSLTEVVGLCLVVKIIASNLMRLIIAVEEKKNKK